MIKKLLVLIATLTIALACSDKANIVSASTHEVVIVEDQVNLTVKNDLNETDLELLVNLLDKVRSVENYDQYSVVEDFAKEVLAERGLEK